MGTGRQMVSWAWVPGAATGGCVASVGLRTGLGAREVGMGAQRTRAAPGGGSWWIRCGWVVSGDHPLRQAALTVLCQEVGQQLGLHCLEDLVLLPLSDGAVSGSLEGLPLASDEILQPGVHRAGAMSVWAKTTSASWPMRLI